MKSILRQYRAQAKDIDEARALYRKEMHQRKLLYNEVSRAVSYHVATEYTFYIGTRAAW